MDRTYQSANGGNRDDWEFEYLGSKLAAAAQEQRNYRVERLKVWEGQKELVMQKVRDHGLTVSEPISEKLSNYSNTSSHRSQIQVDPELQKELDEITSKIREHRSALTAYEGWLQVLTAHPNLSLKLTHNDWMFFFGR